MSVYSTPEVKAFQERTQSSIDHRLGLKGRSPSSNDRDSGGSRHLRYAPYWPIALAGLLQSPHPAQLVLPSRQNGAAHDTTSQTNGHPHLRPRLQHGSPDRGGGSQDYPAEIALVVSNRPEAAGLERARAAGIEAVAIDHKQFATRMAFEARLHQTLLDHRIDLIANAGFMRLLTGGFVDRWRDRHLNIHPSLLPSFPGLDTHTRALEAGVTIAGCTVHFVRLEMDSGPIIAQAAVPVIAGDTAETLGARVLAAEHKLYPVALRLVASSEMRVVNEQIVRSTSGASSAGILLSPSA